VETKEKIRQSNLGQKSSEETKAKLKISRARQIMKPRSEESRKKMSEDRRGDKWYTYKGGITPLRNQIYNSYKYRQWISDVLLKDNYMCECGKVGGRLCAHHIKSFSTILQENKIKTLEEAFNCSELWNINNGRTLCYECHRKTDNYGGRWAKNKKNNDERTI
jgi:5-methylcytosine-specific restriction endonuclease McrA